MVPYDLSLFPPPEFLEYGSSYLTVLQVNVLVDTPISLLSNRLYTFTDVFSKLQMFSAAQLQWPQSFTWDKNHLWGNLNSSSWKFVRAVYPSVRLCHAVQRCSPIDGCCVDQASKALLDYFPRKGILLPSLRCMTHSLDR